MTHCSKLLIISTLISSCSLPDTSLWNERKTAKSIRMPMEATTKVILKGSITSLIRNPFSSTKKGLSMLRNRADIATGSVSSLTVSNEAATIEQRLDQLGMPTPIGGSIDYLIDGKSFFTAFETSIQNAQKTIDTRVFIFDNDDVAVRIANLLKAKSRTVRCRVLMDELGSLTSWWTAPETKMPRDFKPPSSIPHFLKKNSRVQVRESINPWLITDHSKLIIIDQNEAYLGGMNIGREYRHEWHDMMFRLKGPVVSALQNDFNKAWRLQGGLGDWGYPFLRETPYRKTLSKQEIPLRILKTNSHTDVRQIELASLAAIQMAKRRVYIQNSYFTSEPLAQALADASRRGVDVRMIYPESNDSKLLNIGNQEFAQKLLQARAKVYLYPKFTHVKALVVDDWASIGSANYDALSMRINEETNIAYTHKKAVQQLVDQLFNKDFRISKQIKTLPKNWSNKLLQPVINQL